MLKIPTNDNDLLARINELLVYDADTGELRWNVGRRGDVRAGSVAGWMRQDGYIGIKIDYSEYMAHRIVFLVCNGWMPEEVDHRDGNRANNRIENLREATSSQNKFNSTVRSDNTSGHKGVHFDKWSGKWRAQAKIYGKKHSIGRFLTKEAASEAYQSFCFTNHGEFDVTRSRTNQG